MLDLKETLGEDAI